MREFILPSWQEIWLEALSEETHALKLCGAGGGGFVLGLSRDTGLTHTRYSRLRPLFLSI
jgi:galactokinase/mevalonate kinase-like predicted kinase